MIDEEVLEYCEKNRYKKWKNREQKYIDYLLNRFNDFSVNNIYDKCKEALYRLRHNIDNRPRCPICGNNLTYIVNFKFYPTACCNECMNKLKFQKLQQTSFERYGTRIPSQSKEVKFKQKNTNLKKYGTVSALQNKEVQNKTKQTLINKYGVDNIAKSEYWKQHVQETSLKQYGTNYPNQSELVKNKMKQSCLKHYGVDNYFKTEECKAKANSKEAINKGLETKRKNKSLNISLIEIDSLKLLKQKYPDVIYQYKDKQRYPFMCDFYIPSLDLFIECNYHWTHGGKPYENSEIDNILLNQWKEKNTQYYINAINCWTIRDVNKRNIAKQNKLNYIEFFTILDLQNWLSNYEENN